MSLALSHRMSADAALARPLPAPGGSKVAPARKPSHHKVSAGSAWAAWEANGPTSSGSQFLQSVSNWTEGTAAQLLRQRWPAGAKRPTSTEVQQRLRHKLGVAAHGGDATYLEALGLARRGVIQELRRERRPASKTVIEPGMPR
jgi:hypothetical protein